MKNKLVLGLLVLFVLCSVNQAIAGMLTAKTSAVSEVISQGMPRGRGNGSGSFKAFAFGIFALVPVIGLIGAALAYYHGSKNVGRIRKGRGLAIAGLIFATIGIAFTILFFTI